MRLHLERISRHHHISTPFVICTLASVFYVYEFFLRVAPSAMVYPLMSEFHIGAREFGSMSAFFYYAYTPMQIPAGLLFDRFGPRVLMTLGMVTCSLAALIFSMSHSFPMLCLARFLIGFASAFAFIGALVLAARWFPSRYFALIAGLIQAMGCLGAIGGEAPVAALIDQIGWRQTIFLSAMIGAAFSLLFWLIIRDRPKGAYFKQNQEPQAPTGNEWSRLKSVLGNPQTWAISLCSFSCWAPVVGFAALWAIPFVAVDLQISPTAAAGYTSIMWIAIAITSPLAGWWSDRIQSRRIPLLVCSVIGCVSGALIVYLEHPSPWLLSLLLFMLGTSAAAQVITFGFVDDINPPAVAGTSVGINNMAVITSGIVMQPLIGHMLSQAWHGQIKDGAPFYTLSEFQTALVSVPLASLIGLLAAYFLLKETHCQSIYRPPNASKPGEAPQLTSTKTHSQPDIS